MSTQLDRMAARRLAGLTRGLAARDGIVMATTQNIADLSDDPTIQWGSGVPTHAAANGSVWYRTDGGVDTTIYARISGAWQAVANTGAGGAQVDLIFAAATELTIAAGAITATQGAHTIDTEADAASDDLDSIAGGTAEEVIFVRPASAARTVVLKHAVGANLIACPAGEDISLAEATDFAALYFNGTQWVVVGFSVLAKNGGGIGSALASVSAGKGAALVGIEDSGGLYTETTVEAALAGVRTLIKAKASTELTIAAGTVARVQSIHSVDTEADAASDDLDTVTGGAEGDVLILRAENAARTVVLKHSIAANAFACPQAKDVSLAEANDLAVCIHNGSQWVVLPSYLGIPDFAAAGVKADVIAESTGGSGVTIDGTLIKDGGATIADGGVLAIRGAGTGTGDVVEEVGATAAEAWRQVVYDATVAPAAVETNLINLPAGSMLVSVQAVCTVALTGGGTTATWSIGIAADPDKYGSAGFNSIDGSAAADSLAQNSKSTWFGGSAHTLVLSSAAEQLVLTGAATGGAADGDTALTVGSVRVRVIYWQLQALASV